MAILSVALDWADLAIASTAIVGMSTIVGLAVRFILVPYLRTELVEPTREINRQVTGTDSGQDSPDATIRDEVGTLRGEVRGLSGEIEDATLELRAMATMFDGHLAWSQDEVDRIWSELKRQRALGLRPAPGRHREENR